jgi:hypothetical protein
MPFSRACAPLLALALACAVAGCRTTEVLATPPALASAEPLPITLSESLRLWRTERAAATRRRYRVGSTLCTLFSGHDGRAFLSPLTNEFASEFDPAERAFVAHYELRLTLQLDGKSHELVARGTGRSPDDPASAERSAIADCLGVLYASARELLARRGA